MKSTVQLRKERDNLWREFNRMARRESFSGLHVADKLEKVQQELDRRERKPSKRYTCEISIEVG